MLQEDLPKLMNTPPQIAFPLSLGVSMYYIKGEMNEERKS